MVTHHQHVQVFVDGVDGERSCRVGAAGKDVGAAADTNDIRCMPAACSLAVVSMYRPAPESGHAVFDKPTLIERVSVDGDLVACSS